MRITHFDLLVLGCSLQLFVACDKSNDIVSNDRLVEQKPKGTGNWAVSGIYPGSKSRAVKLKLSGSVSKEFSFIYADNKLSAIKELNADFKLTYTKNLLAAFDASIVKNGTTINKTEYTHNAHNQVITKKLTGKPNQGVAYTNNSFYTYEGGRLRAAVEKVVLVNNSKQTTEVSVSEYQNGMPAQMLVTKRLEVFGSPSVSQYWRQFSYDGFGNIVSLQEKPVEGGSFYNISQITYENARIDSGYISTFVFGLALQNCFLPYQESSCKVMSNDYGCFYGNYLPRSELFYVSQDCSRNKINGSRLAKEINFLYQYNPDGIPVSGSITVVEKGCVAVSKTINWTLGFAKVE